MSQKTENGALLEQMENLHKEVRQIAQNMAILHSTEKTIDQKTMVIGQALIKQKKTTEAVIAHQEAMETKAEECQKYVKERNAKLAESVASVEEAVHGLRSLEQREDTLLGSLEKLSKNQTAFMKSNLVFAKTAETDLDQIKDSVKEIKKTITGMDSTNQVAFMTKKTGEIQAALTSYVRNRTKLIQAMDEQTKCTEARIQSIEKNMEKQWQAVSEVIKISGTCEEKTVQMCERLEKLLSQKKLASDIVSMSLEDMFGEKTESVKPVVTEKELSLEDLFLEESTEAAKSATFAQEQEPEIAKYEQEYEKDEASLAGMDEPLTPSMKEQKTVTNADVRPQKKKGFFNRLFGGNS